MTAQSTVAEIPSHSLWWNDGNAFRTRLFDALSLVIPGGEQFLIETVQDWLSEPIGRSSASQSSASAGLRHEARRFVVEEQAHQRAHYRYNERLEAHVPAHRLERRVAASIAEMSGWRLQTRIAFAAAIEHLTAMLSAEVLRADGVWRVTGESPQSRLWQWHCREEIAHQNVVPDILRAAGIGRLRRNLAYIATALYFLTDLSITMAALCKCDLKARRIGKTRLAMQGLRFGIQLGPSLVRMTWDSLKYFVKS